MAQVSFDPEQRYYITCQWNTEGYVCLGSMHDVPYPVYYEMDANRTEDAYWYVKGSEADGFVIQNAKSGEYMVWSDNHADHRYMSVSSELTDIAYWDIIPQYDDWFLIRNRAVPSYYFNLRTGTRQVGTYQGSGDPNGYFSFHPVNGEENPITKERLTVHYVDVSSNYEIDKDQFTFYPPFTLEEFRNINGYKFVSASVELPYTAEEGGDVYVYMKVNKDYDADYTPPFTTTTIIDGKFAPGTTWYRMSIRSGKQLHTEGIDVYCQNYDQPYDPSYFWCFTRTEDGLYQIYNYATGASAPMSASGWGNTTPMLMQDGDTYTAFHLTPNGWGFNVKIPGYESYANDHGGSGKLLLWESAAGAWDNGSSIEIQEVGDVSFKAIEQIILNEEKINMMETEWHELAYSLLPEDATLTSLIWSTSDASVVDVFDEGYGTYLVATGAGDAVITATSAVDPSVSAQCTVHVEPYTRVSSITLSANSLTMTMGQKQQITATLEPEDAYYNFIEWSTSNKDVAMVDEEGNITAYEEGVAIITARSVDDSGCYAQCIVTVKDANAGEIMAHSNEYLYVQQADKALVALPKDFIKEQGLDGKVFKATLITNEAIEMANVESVTDTVPVVLPTFTSYKFNNKFNDQVFTDAEAENPMDTLINLSVSGIGKRLTASFQLEDKDAKVWVGNVEQQSKVTRQRFDRPIDYTIGHEAWKELQIKTMSDGSQETSYIPFGHHTRVIVDWLTDHPTTDYGVPVIRINTDNGTSVTSKDYYWDATMEINGAGVFPDMPATAMQIKGRGNSSWGGSGSKNPYRLKFNEKVKPFGMPKSKSWILLANKQNASMTSNVIGQKIANLMGSAGACHIIPVELYINGQYQGSYNFCEKVGFSNSSIDLDDETYCAMIELDTYGDAGETNFYSNAYGISSKVHDPDVEEPDYDGVLDVHQIIDDFDHMTELVKARDGSYVHNVDVKALASYLATCELMCNSEFQHPKSVFLYSENVTDGVDENGNDPTPWVFGPLWDCDWGFGYEQSGTYFQVNAEGNFFSDLIGHGSPKQFWNDLRYGSEEVDREYYYLWKKFMEDGGIQELIEYCDDYYAFAQHSLHHDRDNVTYNRDYNDYGEVTDRSKSWLKTRARYIYSTLNEYPDPEPEPEPEPVLHKVTFLLAGEPFGEDLMLEAGAEITLPEAPEKEGYTFSGWTFNGGEMAPTHMPDEDITITGTYTVNTYYVIYKVGDTEVNRIEVTYGDKMPDYQYTPEGDRYTFEGWDGEKFDTMPAHDVTYVANLTDGLRTIMAATKQDNRYDLAGRRTNKTNQRGIVVKKGVKILK